MRKIDIKNITYNALMLVCTIAITWWISYTIMSSIPEDFRVFHGSGRAVLAGETIYRTYGPIELPYWYFPWLAWFYIPLAVFPFEIAYGVYVGISLLCAFVTISYITRAFKSASDLLEQLLVLCMTLSMCWLLFRVGQMDFILLAVTALIIHLIHNGKARSAGILAPILLFKPHLYVIFLPFALFKGRKNFLLSSAGICLTLVIVSFLFIPNWPQQMIEMLAQSGQRTDNNWNFTTLPTLLGMQENWSGTANLPITIVLILTAFIITWRFRDLDTLPLLSLALAASLFCAPRAYSYNFPLLIPAMLWVSAGWTKYARLLFWLAAGAVPFLFRFSTGMYSIVLIVFALGILKAHTVLFGPDQKQEVPS